MARVSLVLATLLLQLVVGEDVYWARNSNWNNADNWRYGRPPCSGEIASFAEAPANSLVYLNTNITVKSIVLPTNGKLVLKPGLTIRFSNESSCTVPGDSQPMVAGLDKVNEFIGARVWPWECPDNWASEDGSPVARSPCGEDNAIFREGSSYSFVRSNQSISVRSLSVRGNDIQTASDLQSSEFQLNLTINSACGTDSALCPCLSVTECPDIDECQLGIANCHSNATCINTLGTYSCQCKQGYQGNGTLCTDINECVEGIANCHGNATCINTLGTYLCQCKQGYRGNGISCTDINECVEGTAICHSNAACVNTDGGYYCYCNKGYIGDGISCSVTDDCTRNTNSCHRNADCVNINGSFICQCLSGFTGDGQTDCRDVDECELKINSCDENSDCFNTEGSYKCVCKLGYEDEDGVVCTDIDECQLGIANCHSNATCINTLGTYSCRCKQGYQGNGTLCTAEAKPSEGPNMIAIIVGVVAAVLVVMAAIVIAVILGIIIYHRRKQTISYFKDDLIEPEGDVFKGAEKSADKENDSVTFSNPIYSTHTHAPADDDIGLIGAEIMTEEQPDLKHEYEKVDFSALNEYEIQ